MQWYAHEWIHAETFVEARAVGEERGQSRLKEHTEYHLIVATDTQQRELSTISPSCGENERRQRQKTSYYQQHQTRVRLNNYST